MNKNKRKRIKNSDKRVLIYSQDGFGLGHLRRNLNISYRVKKLDPSASILIIVDSPEAPFFNLPPKCDFIKIPTLVKVDMGFWRSDRLPVNYKEILHIRSDIIKNVVLSYRPHTFLVDHMPNGVLGELLEPFQMVKRHLPETKIILGLRDILGDPKAICNQWQKDDAYNILETFYDHTIVYGSQDLFNLPVAYRFPAAISARTSYCGYVCRDNETVPDFNGDLSNLFSEKKEWLVVVTGGGGHDTSYFMDTFMETVHAMSSHLPFNSIINVGPFMHEDQSRLLKQKAGGLPVVVTESRQDIIHYLKKADLVISMAGYNTISEIMRYRKKAIIIPRPGPSAEQTMRTQIMSQRGLFNTIHPRDLTAGNLSELILKTLSNGYAMNEEMIPELNGAANAAEAMFSTID